MQAGGQGGVPRADERDLHQQLQLDWGTHTPAVEGHHAERHGCGLITIEGDTGLGGACVPVCNGVPADLGPLTAPSPVLTAVMPG